MSHRQPNSLTGFGPIGWLAAGVGLALLIAIFRGVDVQAQLLRAIDAVAGWPGVYWFVSRPLASMAYSLFDPVFGFIPLAGLLIAARIVPRRPAVFAQWLAVACGIVGAAGLINAHIVLHALFGPRAWFVPGYQTFTLLVACALSLWMFRFSLVTLMFCCALAVPSFGAFLRTLNAPTFDISHPGLVGYAIGFDFAPFVALTLIAPIAWAVHQRRSNPADPDTTCEHCGYAREGLPADAPCPECGSALTNSTPPARC